MKRIISLTISLLLTLLLAAGLFSVTALAELAASTPESVEISYGATATTFVLQYSDNTNEAARLRNSSTSILFHCDENDDEFSAYVSADESDLSLGDGEIEFTVKISQEDWDDLDPGTSYHSTFNWSIIGESTSSIAYGSVSLTFSVPDEDDSSEESSEPEESSEESSEPEEESSTTEEESSTTEEESSAAEEESSAAESESESASESSQSSKTSKPQNPGKPDELSMGGSIGGASESGKPAPDTGMSYAPLAALGVAAMAGLAVMAFRKK